MPPGFRHQLSRLDDRLPEHRLAFCRAAALGRSAALADAPFGALLAHAETFPETSEAARRRGDLWQQLAAVE